MEYPKHYRVAVRMLADVDEPDDPFIQDEIERLEVLDR